MSPAGTPGQYGQYDIPPAFLRDDDLPPPPPSDPHWREWPHHDGGGSRRPHRLLAYALPLGALLVLAVLILLVKVLVLS